MLMLYGFPALSCSLFDSVKMMELEDFTDRKITDFI